MVFNFIFLNLIFLSVNAQEDAPNQVLYLRLSFGIGLLLKICLMHLGEITKTTMPPWSLYKLVLVQ